MQVVNRKGNIQTFTPNISIMGGKDKEGQTHTKNPPNSVKENYAKKRGKTQTKSPNSRHAAFKKRGSINMLKEKKKDTDSHEV